MNKKEIKQIVACIAGLFIIWGLIVHEKNLHYKEQTQKIDPANFHGIEKAALSSKVSVKARNLKVVLEPTNTFKINNTNILQFVLPLVAYRVSEATPNWQTIDSATNDSPFFYDALEVFVGSTTGNYSSDFIIQFPTNGIFGVEWHTPTPIFVAIAFLSLSGSNAVTCVTNLPSTNQFYTNSQTTVVCTTNLYIAGPLSDEIMGVPTNALPICQISNGFPQIIGYGFSNKVYTIHSGPTAKGITSTVIDTIIGTNGPWVFQDSSLQTERFYKITSTH